VPNARFFFDAGSGGVLWTTDPKDWETWGHPVDIDLLPISQELRVELDRLIAWYDTSLNWDYPPNPGPWRESECQQFSQAVHKSLTRLGHELGATWTIINKFTELHEDPDLDRYLADSKNFRR